MESKLRGKVLLVIVWTLVTSLAQVTAKGHKKRLILDGEVSLESLAAEVIALKNIVNTLQQSSGHGSIYVRWGSKTCPTNVSELVYSGYPGGSFWTENGGAANTLCLSPDPQWGYYEDNIGSAAHVFGAEFETCDYHADCGKHFFGKATNDEDMSCAVCMSPRTRQLMIPGRKDCYSGWTKEYSGYLMAGSYAHVSATEFICVDQHPDLLVGGHPNQDGRTFYFAEGRCGSLKCPPYVNGRELTCVVCTR